MGVEAAAAQRVVGDQAPGIGHPLVDQHQAGGVLLQQRGQRLPRIRPRTIRLRHQVEAFAAPELPGHLPPQGPHLGAVSLDGRGPRSDAGAD